MKPSKARTSRVSSADPSPATQRIGLVMTGLLLSVFLAMLDAQIVATAIPRLVADLGGLDQLAWITTAYVISSTVMTPIYGKLSDLFGRKEVFLLAILLFVVGSAASGAAQSMGQFITFRVVQGIGAGGLFVSVLSIIGGMLSPRAAAKYYGYFSLAFAASALAGPPLGGLLTDLVGWRWVFLVNVPIGVGALVLVGRHLELPRTVRPVRIDYAGVLLLSTAVVAASLVTTWAGTKYDWSSPVIVVLIAVALVATAAFVPVERKAVEPVIPPHLFRNPTFTVCALVSFAAGFVFLGAVNFLALFTQAVTGASPMVSGLLLLPMMAGLVASSIVSSKRISQTGSYRWYPVLSMALGIVATAAMATMNADTSRPLAAVYMFVLGVAAGLNMQVLTMAAQNTASPEDIGAVSATITFSRAIGTSLGISIFAAVFYGPLHDHLSRRLPAAALRTFDLDRAADAEKVRQLPADVRHGLAQAYADSLSPVFLLAAVVLAGGLACALFLKDIPLRSRDEDAREDDGPAADTTNDRPA
ncbi:MDR family MFS transporter [Streptomyces massasporeus]|uniref:MDR family MFS transporter n=1 Tax=Streptomyces massasporeus TaxID=67324 RepID=UPI003803F5C3